jgi:hypothetical protein
MCNDFRKVSKQNFILQGGVLIYQIVNFGELVSHSTSIQ